MELNRAVAVSEIEGPDAALEIVDTLELAKGEPERRLLERRLAEL